MHRESQSSSCLQSFACLLGCLAFACSGSSSPATDGGPGSDAGPDAGIDAGIDAGSDAGNDAGEGFPDGGTGALSGSLSIALDPDEGLGIFDPSAAYDAVLDAGFLVYSTVAPDQAHVHTRIATSLDQGASWTFVSEPTTAAAATISTTDNTVCGAPSCSGTMVHEVSSLIIDASDSSDRRYKIFTHSYFAVSSTSLHYNIGTLDLETAASASGPWTTTHLLGWNGVSPTSTAAAQNISTDPSLAGVAKCIALTEPGAMLRESGGGSVIELAVGCVFAQNGAGAIEIDLLRSTDHAQSFSFVATLLSASDATALGSNTPQINAPDLFSYAGETWLFATPGGTTDFPGGGTGDGYRGCLLLEMADVDAGTLVRNSASQPLVTASYPGAARQFVGACTFDAPLPKLGVAGDVLNTAASAPFTIFELR